MSNCYHCSKELELKNLKCRHCHAPHIPKNYFEIFTIEESFRIDEEKLEDEYFQLQMSFHPDKIPSNLQELSSKYQQAAIFINDAYNVLSSPLSRANYMLTLIGGDAFDSTENRKVDISVLEKQMEIREKLLTVTDKAEEQQIKQAAATEVNKLYQKIDTYYDKKDKNALLKTIQEIKFYLAIV